MIQNCRQIAIPLQRTAGNQHEYPNVSTESESYEMGHKASLRNIWRWTGLHFFSQLPYSVISASHKERGRVLELQISSICHIQLLQPTTKSGAEF